MTAEVGRLVNGWWTWLVGEKLLALVFSMGCRSRADKSGSEVVTMVLVAGRGEIATVGKSASGVVSKVSVAGCGEIATE